MAVVSTGWRIHPYGPEHQVAKWAHKHSEPPPRASESGSDKDTGRVKKLEKQVFDLQITNRGKDYLVEQLQTERDGFFDKLLQASRKVGELETKLQLEGPKPETDGTNG